MPILIDEACTRQFNIGDQVVTFRKEKAKLIGMREPHKPGSTGRVTLKFRNGDEREFFPGVIGAKWINTWSEVLDEKTNLNCA